MVTAVNLTNGVAVGEEMDASETAPPEVRLVSVNTAARLLDIGRTTTFCLGPPLHLARPRVRDGPREGDGVAPEVHIFPSQGDQRPPPGPHGGGQLNEYPEICGSHQLHGPHLSHIRDGQRAGLHPWRIGR